MCGRYAITTAPEILKQLFNYPEMPNFPARYNVAPTQPVPVVSQEHGARHFRLMRWGLIPSWVKDRRRFALVINARSETIREKPAFKDALQRRRCLVPANGYYEWQETNGRKRPFFIQPHDRNPIAFAGVAETWAGPNGEEVETVAIVSTAASPDMASLHHRVPVTIVPDDFDRWLDCAASDVDDALALLVAPTPGSFVWHEVSMAVNRVINDSPQLMLPISEEQSAAEQATDLARRKPPRTRVAVSDADQGSLF